MTFPFIVFEGIDGSGKTSLRNALWDRLLEFDIPTIAMGQHSWLDVGQSRLLMDLRSNQADEGFGRPYGQVAEAYLKDKWLHWSTTIQPALQHAVVILDRYYLSDAVYLSALYGMNRDALLRSYDDLQIGKPDLLVHLDLDPRDAERRIEKRARESRHYEREAPLARVRASYSEVLSGRDRERTVSVNGRVLTTRSANWEEQGRALEEIMTDVLRRLEDRSGKDAASDGEGLD